MALDNTTDYRAGMNLVWFDSDGVRLAGLLFLPYDYDYKNPKQNSYKAAVVTRPASGVKEQTAGRYAREFASVGNMVTLAFDPKGYGGSSGRPLVEDPFSIISDTKNAATFLENLPMVDPKQLFSIGVCMGAGYSAAATSEDPRFKASIMISPYLTGHIDYPKAYGGRIPVAIGMALLKPLSWFFDLFFPPVPIHWFDRLTPILPVQLGMLQYYGPGKPGNTPGWSNWVNLYKADIVMLGKYNPFNFQKKYSQTSKPLFEAYAENGFRPDLLQKFGDDIVVPKKKVIKIPNVNHFDLYYKTEHVDFITKEAMDFINSI